MARGQSPVSAADVPVPDSLTRRAAVLGSPIAHSLSPVLHRAGYLDLGLEWRYDAIEVTQESLAAFVAGCGPEWAGLSLTMPLKRAVLPLLDTRAALVDVVGAANTVVFGAGGERAGHNTDVAGIVAALRGIDAAAGPALVLGGGATAASALAALAELGCLEVAWWPAVPRSPGRRWQGLPIASGSPWTVGSWPVPGARLPDADEVAGGRHHRSSRGGCVPRRRGAGPPRRSARRVLRALAARARPRLGSGRGPRGRR